MPKNKCSMKAEGVTTYNACLYKAFRVSTSSIEFGKDYPASEPKLRRCKVRPRCVSTCFVGCEVYVMYVRERTVKAVLLGALNDGSAERLIIMYNYTCIRGINIFMLGGRIRPASMYFTCQRLFREIHNMP